MLRPESLLGSIDRKLAATLLLLLTVLAAVVLVYGASTTRHYVEEVEQRFQFELAAHLVDEEPLFDSGDIDPAALENVFHTLMVINPRIECYLTDPTGRLLAWNAPEGSVQLERVSMEPIRAFLEGAPLPLRGDDPRHPDSPKIFSVAPITIPSPSTGSEELQGYLYVVLAGELYASVADRLASSYILRESLVMALLVVGVTALIGVLLFRFLTRRLRSLDQRMSAFGQGDFSERDRLPAGPPPGPSGIPDEIDRLDDSFRRMAERIGDHVEQLSSTDRLRRELVANVSHDLRTPVATLRGYVETLLLKDRALPPEERRLYLEITLAQSERLGRLVEELFELARLDSGDIALEREPFSIAELVQDVTQKFSLRAQECGVTLSTDLETPVPAVVGDLRLIERTLENLIENALRHTDGGGVVKVVVSPEERGARVVVSDDGCGIPAEDLPHIFNRFYRGSQEAASSSRGTGSGLGLAIASRVIEMHDSSIDVRSEEGRGASFSFALASRSAPQSDWSPKP